MNEDLILLLGASIRAVAQSCHRAGLVCRGADLFGDVDARQHANATRVEQYPAGLADFAEEIPPGAWMYTGGLENHPALIDRISRRHRLLGNAGDVVARVRDPIAMTQVLHEAELPAPLTLREPPAAEGEEQWLRKPLRSCGGMNVEPYRADSTSSPTPTGSTYWQEFIPGKPLAAAFVGLDGHAELLGVTEQLIGHPWTGAMAFQYAGTVGPVTLESSVTDQLKRLGEVLTHKFRLLGLFGVDGILNGSQFWPVEVNPRYTASVEVLERASGASAIARHLAAFRCDCPQRQLETDKDNPIHGKAIVFANSDVRIGDAFAEHLAAKNKDIESPQIADIPHRGNEIAKGHPVATVFAQGNSQEVAFAQLRQRTAELRSVLETMPAVTR